MSNQAANDDQIKLNTALNDLRLKFDEHVSNTSWQGRARVRTSSNRHSTLNITVIPMRHICRGRDCTLDLLPECYVWHQGAQHNLTEVVEKAEKAKVWLLRKNWSEITKTSLTGLEWLRALILD